jgi:PAS domain S-box-containing protein
LEKRATSTLRWIGEHSEQVLAARDDPERLFTVFQNSAVPMTMLDDDRRWLEANRAAREVLGATLEELRQLRADDLTPPYLLAVLVDNWERMLETGCVMSTEVERPEGHYLGLSYYQVANVLPGRHLLAFAPPGWPGTDGDEDGLAHALASGAHLTPRELQVLTLSADGLNGPGVANALGLSAATVRTHFAHIYQKLDVSDRAAAVAKAMRIGLIR